MIIFVVVLFFNLYLLFMHKIRPALRITFLVCLGISMIVFSLNLAKIFYLPFILAELIYAFLQVLWINRLSHYRNMSSDELAIYSRNNYIVYLLNFTLPLLILGYHLFFDDSFQFWGFINFLIVTNLYVLKRNYEMCFIIDRKLVLLGPFKIVAIPLEDILFIKYVANVIVSVNENYGQDENSYLFYATKHSDKYLMNGSNYKANTIRDLYCLEELYFLGSKYDKGTKAKEDEHGNKFLLLKLDELIMVPTNQEFLAFLEKHTGKQFMKAAHIAK